MNTVYIFGDISQCAPPATSGEITETFTCNDKSERVLCMIVYKIKYSLMVLIMGGSTSVQAEAFLKIIILKYLGDMV
jgi:hypothetical protein